MAKTTHTKKPSTISGPSRLQRLLRRVNREMYARNVELAETNQTLSLLRSVDALVLESHDELNVLCQKVASSIIEHSNYGFAAVCASPVTSDKIELYGIENSFGVVADPKKFPVRLNIHTGWIVDSEKSTIIDLSPPAIKETSHLFEGHSSYMAEFIKNLPIKSLMLTKLLARQRIVGVMMVGFTQEINAISEKQRTSVDRLSEAVGVAVDNKLLYEENQRVLDRLQKTNEKLKELDETKDEFISMASHQLRTPLTSVKGYLSMVLEGDGGKLNSMQTKLLNQAFVSSQRMVYLIADLLNVSRLKTGKFILDLVPTNLAEVVEGEVAQLREEAKSKNLIFNYDKPKNFPELMLDETKIRQVVMNFADNAIYYTPKGGRIDIQLKHDKSSVYFLVKDNGLGVPKDEQHELFGKFYRASNARQARPDGTGLGLFMAKRVVSAQGGSILFESFEGKGSTFGFKFDLKKHKVEPKA